MSIRPRVAAGAPAGTGGQFVANARPNTNVPLHAVAVPSRLDDDLLDKSGRPFRSLRDGLAWIEEDPSIVGCRPPAGLWAEHDPRVIDSALSGRLSEGPCDDFRALVQHHGWLWGIRDASLVGFDDDTVTLRHDIHVFTIDRRTELLSATF